MMIFSLTNRARKCIFCLLGMNHCRIPGKKTKKCALCLVRVQILKSMHKGHLACTLTVSAIESRLLGCQEIFSAEESRLTKPAQQLSNLMIRFQKIVTQDRAPQVWSQTYSSMSNGRFFFVSVSMVISLTVTPGTALRAVLQSSPWQIYHHCYISQKSVTVSY